VKIADVGKNQVRFGFSPARECLRGIHVLVRPAGHAEQLPWVRAARRRFSRDLRAAIDRFMFFFEDRAESFPFLWDECRGEDFAVELHALRSNLDVYRDTVLVRLGGKRLVAAGELREMRRPRAYRSAAAAYATRNPRSAPMLEQFVASPAQSLRAFCAMLDAFHAQVFVPGWASIHERLTSDIGMRKRLLRDFGITALLRTLAPDISAQRTSRGSNLELGQSDVSLRFEAGSSITLTPSFFCGPGHEAYVLRTNAGLRCTIAYPIPPLTARAAKLEGRDAVAAICTALGDRVRLRIMELLNVRELSTRELSAFLLLAEPVVSRHLQVLLRAGLVQRRRSSYFVMYAVRRETLQRLTDALAPLR
jgi:DNA-binding transcriptional ArsR family regulator